MSGRLNLRSSNGSRSSKSKASAAAKSAMVAPQHEGGDCESGSECSTCSPSPSYSASDPACASDCESTESGLSKNKQKKTRGRVKIGIKLIDQKQKRNATFHKRKTGLMKKGFELSALTGAEVLVLVAWHDSVFSYGTDRLRRVLTSTTGQSLIQQCLQMPERDRTGSNSGMRWSSKDFIRRDLNMRLSACRPKSADSTVEDSLLQQSADSGSTCSDTPLPNSGLTTGGPSNWIHMTSGGNRGNSGGPGLGQQASESSPHWSTSSGGGAGGGGNGSTGSTATGSATSAAAAAAAMAATAWQPMTPSNIGWQGPSTNYQFSDSSPSYQSAASLSSPPAMSGSQPINCSYSPLYGTAASGGGGSFPAMNQQSDSASTDSGTGSCGTSVGAGNQFPMSFDLLSPPDSGRTASRTSVATRSTMLHQPQLKTVDSPTQASSYYLPMTPQRGGTGSGMVPSHTMMGGTDKLGGSYGAGTGTGGGGGGATGSVVGSGGGISSQLFQPGNMPFAGGASHLPPLSLSYLPPGNMYTTSQAGNTMASGGGFAATTSVSADTISGGASKATGIIGNTAAAHGHLTRGSWSSSAASVSPMTTAAGQVGGASVDHLGQRSTSAKVGTGHSYLPNMTMPLSPTLDVESTPMQMTTGQRSTGPSPYASFPTTGLTGLGSTATTQVGGAVSGLSLQQTRSF